MARIRVGILDDYGIRAAFMPTYLITGGAGFIGSNFIHYLFGKYGKNVKIVNLDLLTYAGNPENLSELPADSDYRFIWGDICDGKLVGEILAAYEPDFIVNFAAESHVDRSICDSSDFIRTNVLGTQVLLDCALRRWRIGGEAAKEKRFLQVSTDEVYGTLGTEGFFYENSPLCPRNPYAAAKASADLLALSYFTTYGMPVLITRCGNNFGPRQFPEKLIPLSVACLAKGEKIPLYGDGGNIREWVYVYEHARAVDMVLHSGKIGSVYNIASGCEQSNLAVTGKIFEVFRKFSDRPVSPYFEDHIVYVEDRPGHDFRYALDGSKIADELGFHSSAIFDGALESTVLWYLEHRDYLSASGAV